jgi:hypothetical protein
MRRLLASITLMATIAALSVPAFADRTYYTVQVFSGYSGLAGTARTSAAYRLNDPQHYGLRGFQINGVNAAGTFVNMSGHNFAIHCAPASTGPWASCSGAAGTALAFTTSNTNGVAGLEQSWKGAAPYVRFSFTRASGKSAANRVSAWLYYGEDY